MSTTPGSIQALAEKTLRSRIMVCYGLCAIAESEVHAGQIARATGSIQAIRQVLRDINLLTTDPRTLSEEPIRNLNEMLEELDRWAWHIGRAICRSEVC
ncbi:MAG TPA: hypothetical protein VGG72_28975 [Bryobacteraceae bacterium]|jgi:hypothetical protein